MAPVMLLMIDPWGRPFEAAAVLLPGVVPVPGNHRQPLCNGGFGDIHESSDFGLARKRRAEARRRPQKADPTNGAARATTSQSPLRVYFSGAGVASSLLISWTAFQDPSACFL